MQIDDEYFDSKEFKEVLNSYEESIESGDTPFMDVDDLVDIADYYNYKGKAAKSREAIGLALELYPEAASPLIFKACEELRNGRIENAEELAGCVTDKETPDYKYLEAEILIAKNEIDKAEKFLHEYFMTVEPDDYDDFVLDIANIYIDYGINDKAYQWMTRAKNHHSSDYKELMARALFGMGKFSDSADIFNELIDENPYSKNYWNALASAQFMEEKFSDAITSSEYAIAIDPTDPDGLIAKANGLYRLGNYEEALKYYERYCDVVPDDEFGWLNTGTCLAYLDLYDKAIEALLKAEAAAQSSSPYRVQIYHELAFAYSAKKMPDKALEVLDKTKSIDCNHADIDVLKGHILLENGRLEEAEDIYKQAIIKSESNPEIVLRITVSLYDNKYIEAAYNMFKKLFEVTEDGFNQGYAYMARCCWDMKKADEFLYYLKIAVKRNPKEAENVLSNIFPKDIKPENYFDYMINKLNIK
ncbi:lipopolysaccharide assembly protein LapB [Prevotella sp. MGM1]|uniref:tetratricopeptide repeat protein n=1 Tax=Prevotella sp. MGM1 TaxID=2033405 RepID=UPI000CEA385F|nr:tetratricopeptide repeat protein [Prevotella sp. MGM1]GAY27598.1 hypothetical protein PvtlMGM1_0898 [Prevotella sp. MGM1]